jgi:hypothetical protein
MLFAKPQHLTVEEARLTEVKFCLISTAMIALIMEAVLTSQAPIYFYETARVHIPEGSNLCTLCH